MKNPFSKPQDDGAIRDEDGNVVAVRVGGTTLDEQMHAVFAGAPSVELTPGDVRGTTERPPTAEQVQRDNDARSFGMRYDPERKCVHLPAPAPGQNEQLFKRTENDLVRALGMREAFKVLDDVEAGDRPAIAAFLASKGLLQPHEIAHLRWLATAKDPIDDVVAPTVPISGEQARRILGRLGLDGTETRASGWGT